MKKSMLLLLIATATIWLLSLVIKPLRGHVYVKDNVSYVPKDGLSKAIASLNKIGDAKPYHLEKIQHVRIVGGQGNTMVSFNQGDTATLQLSNNKGNISFAPTIEKDTLILTITEDEFHQVEISLGDLGLQSITLDGVTGTCYLPQQLVNNAWIGVLNITNASNVTLWKPSRAETTFYPTLNLEIKGKSLLEAEQIRIQNLNVKMNNGMFKFEPKNACDTLRADLQGLSNIKVGNYPTQSGVKVLELTGNLDYYNSKRPK